MNSDPLNGSSSVSADNEGELDLGQLLSMLWSGRYVLATGVIIGLLAGILYLVAAKPIYVADGLVQVEQEGKNGSGAMSELSTIFGVPMETEAEIQILRSRMVLGKVIGKLNLEIDAQPHFFPVIGAFIARTRGRNGNLAPPIFGLNQYAWSAESIDVSNFQVPENMLGSTFELALLDESTFSLRTSKEIEILKGRVGEYAKAMTPSGPVEIFVKDINANVGTKFLITRLPLPDILRALGAQLTVMEAGKQSGVIQLSLEGPSPRYVSGVIQQIEDAYLRQNVERRSAEAEQSLEFLQKQLPDLRARVDAAQAKLNAYQMKQGSVDITKETDIVLQQAVGIETKKLELLAQRQQAIQRFTSQHPAIQAIDAQIRDLDQEHIGIKKRTESLPETQQEVLSLMRDLEVNTQIYTTLLNSAQELQVAKAGTVGNVRIIDYPLLPTKKSKPRGTIVLAISIFAGFIFSLGYILLQKILFRGVDKPDEVERELGLATYAAIPYTASQKRLAVVARKATSEASILAVREPDNVAIESLRSLRTSLQFALLEARNNIIMLTGPTPGLGKSFVSINLAAVLAQSGKKVVIVDGDLRRGHLHKYINQTAAPGLSDYVAGNADLESIVRKTDVNGLTAVTNGTTPPNPSELLLHERFTQLLEHLSQTHDLVVIDTPPVLPVTDASIIGRLSGCVLLALKEGAHPMRMIEETVRRLRQAGVQIRGTIFNQVGVSGGGYGYYSSYYKYSYSSKYESESRR